MYPRIKDVFPLENYILKVIFDDGKTVLYDVKDDAKRIPSYSPLIKIYKLFEQFQVDSSRTVIYWNEEIDLPSDVIYERGKQI
ncbi:MAG: DUF2442 domain-containing protein [Selenomonadaceae bacterium]|nr:DUF2442 domain-containing protein [Selenomonadaceae bacterium]MBR3723053.1 DUF2442 domain-containing protein [Selenomonadaceae bacterium]